MRSLFNLLLQFLSVGMFLTFAAGEGAPDLRGAVSELGGTAPAAAEPDIFDGVVDEAPAADSSVDDGAAEEQIEEEAPVEEEQPAAEEPVEEEVSEEEPPAEEEDPNAPVDERTDEEKAADAAAKAAKQAAPAKKPLTEAQKKEAETLAQLYRDVPKLKEAFKTFPEIRGHFFKAAEINKVFPGGVREATQAKQWAEGLFKFDSLYYGAGPGDTESKREFLNTLFQESLDGSGKSLGHYETMAELVVGDTLANIEDALKKQPHLASSVSPELNANHIATSIEIIKRAISLLNGKPAVKGIPRGQQASIDPALDTAKMTPIERRLYEENLALKAEKSAVEQSKSATSEQEFHGSIYKSFKDGLQPEIDKRLPGVVKGRGWLQNQFGKDVLERVQNHLRQDSFFDAQLRAAARSGDRGQQHIAQLGDMLKQRALTVLPTIVRQVVAEMQTPAPGSQPNQRPGTTRVRGNERPHREPATGGSPGRLSKPSGRSSAPGARPAPSQRPMKSTGDYNRDADRILGIE